MNPSTSTADPGGGPRIHRLGPDLVNKIAAGEVVERPASVVKELVENAIDADSARIEVTLEDGGKKLIRVVDDGIGMSATDLSLLFESHATSKIAGVDDLFRIRTLGFRGEALASIAAVSRCRAVSRERGSPEGASAQCEAGRVGEVRACGAPEGTLLEVRDLFFNTPARFKFLRSTATELRHIVEMMTRLALPHHALALSLVHNGKPVLKLPRCAPDRVEPFAHEIRAERLEALYGGEFCKRLLPVRSESSAMILAGFASPPGEGEASSIQHFFLNGRAIRDRALQRAVAEAYRGRLLRGRFPAAFLNLQIDPGRVDVNVHPTKIEVRFRDSGAVFAQVLTALENALRSAGPAPAASTKDTAPRSAAERRENVRKAVTEFFERSSSPPQSAESGLRSAERGVRTEPVPIPQSAIPGALARPSLIPQSEAPTIPQSAIRIPQSPAATEAGPAESPGAAPLGGTPPRNFFQLHDRYIVEEVEGGFLVADQHALHERILYDELRQRVSHASVPRQRLLIPEIVDLKPGDYLRAMELRETFLKMGMEVESFGEKTVAVHAVPHLAGSANPRELLLEILRETAEEAEDAPGGRQEQLMRVIACKAAIKAGDRLSREKIEALLQRRDRIGPEPTCPHGRPTTLRFDLRDIERQFLRK